MDVPFFEKIGATIPCHFLKDRTHFSVSLARKVQSHKLKRHYVVYKDAGFLTLFQVHTYDDSKFFYLFQNVYP